MAKEKSKNESGIALQAPPKLTADQIPEELRLQIISEHAQKVRGSTRTIASVLEFVDAVKLACKTIGASIGDLSSDLEKVRDRDGVERYRDTREYWEPHQKMKTDLLQAVVDWKIHFMEHVKLDVVVYGIPHTNEPSVYVGCNGVVKTLKVHRERSARRTERPKGDEIPLSLYLSLVESYTIEYQAESTRDERTGAERIENTAIYHRYRTDAKVLRVNAMWEEKLQAFLDLASNTAWGMDADADAEIIKRFLAEHKPSITAKVN